MRFAKGLEIRYYQTHCPNPKCDYPLNVFDKDIHSGMVICPVCREEFGLIILTDD